MTYCPEIERTISHARRKQVVRRPLFPGYCFVGTDPLVTQWRPILSTFGVRRIVRFGEQMGYLPPNFIAALRAREINGLVCRPPSPFGPGESVRIKEGAFEGVVAQILEIGENDRIKVLLELLQLPVKIDVNVRDLAKI